MVPTLQPITIKHMHKNHKNYLYCFHSKSIAMRLLANEVKGSIAYLDDLCTRERSAFDLLSFRDNEDRFSGAFLPVVPYKTIGMAIAAKPCFRHVSLYVGIQV